MDTTPHNIETLFLQLGLPHRAEDIDSFIETHKHLPADVPLPQADFWNPSQAEFLREALEQDSDWCAIVDELDRELRS